MCDVSTCYNNRPCVMVVEVGAHEEGAHRGERTILGEPAFHFKPTSTGVRSAPPRPPSLPSKQHKRQVELTHTKHHRARFPFYPETQENRVQHTHLRYTKKNIAREQSHAPRQYIKPLFTKISGISEGKQATKLYGDGGIDHQPNKEGQAPVDYRG